jgi:hypothetical protein
MTKKLTVNSTVFEYPTTGGYNWGEESSAWAEAVTEVLETLSGPEDIQTTEANLTNGGSGNITGLSFNASLVLQVAIKAAVTRTFTDATPTRVEAFTFLGAYDGSSFVLAYESLPVGTEVGVTFDIDNTGQVNYVAQSVANTDTLTIKFNATAITS